jgi:metal-dependent HD superfamily phosphatase/phosphodiesterase
MRSHRNEAGPERVGSAAVSQDELQQRIDEPVSQEAVEETRLTPAEATAQMRINVPAQRNRKLRTLLERVNADEQLKAWWHVANVNAVKRLGINDHSWVHIQIVANIGLRLLRLLAKRGLERDDAEVVVVLGALLHCVGMAVHRDRHEDWSLFLAEPKARELLRGIYEEPELTVVVSEVLETITSHRESGRPLTLEAGIVRVADALDIEEGRSRIPFERGSVSIHSISAAAIDEVVISEGEERAVLVEIKMNNSAGLYQVDELLKAKLHGSGLEPYVEVVARIDTEAEKSLVPLYRLE